MAYEIGRAATHQASSLAYGYAVFNTQANLQVAGVVIDLVQVYAELNITDAVVALLINSSTHKSVDTFTLGNITAGSTQTFTGCDLTTTSSAYHFLGIYFTLGSISRGTTGVGGFFCYNGTDGFDSNDHTFEWYNGDQISLYGRTYGLPTVTTQAASNITATTATGNGTITDVGGVGCTIRGIQWDIHTHSGGDYANDIHEHGSYGAEAFQISLTSLPPDTTIYARAYATNVDGTGYGDEVTFTTTVRTVAVGGTLTLTGSVTKSISKTLSGAITPSGTLTKTMYKTLSGALTFIGNIARGRLMSVAIGGILSFVGTLTGCNPNWLEIHPWQTWKGEWDQTTEYVVGDVVLYADGDAIHAFMSKTTHNTGNLPTDITHWTRLLQEGWRV